MFNVPAKTYFLQYIEPLYFPWVAGIALEFVHWQRLVRKTESYAIT